MEQFTSFESDSRGEKSETPRTREDLIRQLAQAANEPGISNAEHMRRVEVLERESQAFELSQQAGR